MKQKQKQKIFICYVDGGCLSNGTAEAEGYGSFSIYMLDNQLEIKELPQYSFYPDPNDRMHELQILKEKINPDDPKHRHNLTMLHHNERFPIFPYEEKMSNNIAELTSLQVLLRKLLIKNYISKNQEKPSVAIYMDSQLTINQFNKVWNVKDRRLRSIHENMDYFINKNNLRNSFALGWIPGELMKLVLGH